MKGALAGIVLALATAAWPGGAEPATQPAGPAILFCSPQGAAGGWVDLTYLAELRAKLFEACSNDQIPRLTQVGAGVYCLEDRLFPMF